MRNACRYACTYVGHVCMYVSIGSAWVFLCMTLHLQVCMHVVWGMYVHMYVWMHVRIYVYSACM